MASKEQGELTKEKFIKSGVRLALKIGFSNLTKKNISEYSGLQAGLIFHHFKTIENLKKEVRKELIKIYLKKTSRFFEKELNAILK